MYFSKSTSLCTGGSSTHKNIGRCPDRHRWNRTIYILNKNRPMHIQSVQTPAGRRPGNVRCLTDVILPSMTLQNAVREPWNFK